MWIDDVYWASIVRRNLEADVRWELASKTKEQKVIEDVTAILNEVKNESDTKVKGRDDGDDSKGVPGRPVGKTKESIRKKTPVGGNKGKTNKAKI